MIRLKTILLVILLAIGACSKSQIIPGVIGGAVAPLSTLATPSWNTPTVVSTSQVNLSWNAVTSATTYTVDRALYSGGAWTNIYSGSGTSTNSTGLSAGTHYQWRVKASAAGFNGSAYAYTDATTEAGSNTIPFYIVIGQSNTGWLSATQVTDQSRFVGVHSYAKIWNSGTQGYSTIWETMNSGGNTRAHNYATVTGIGFESSLAVGLQEDLPATERRYFKYGFGGTMIAASDPTISWHPTLGYKFSDFTDFLTLACSQANAQGKVLQLKAILWAQGEEDSKIEANANAYLANLYTFWGGVDNLLTSLATTYSHSFPLTYQKVIMRISNSAAWTYRSAVRDAQADFCDEPDNNAVLVNTDDIDLAGDNQHYTSDGQMVIGLRMKDVLIAEGAVKAKPRKSPVISLAKHITKKKAA